MPPEDSDGTGGPGAGQAPGEGAPGSADEALRRASAHGRAAAAEALAALRALIEAAWLAASGEPLDERSLLGLVARSFDELAAGLARSNGLDSPLLASVAEALDAEIGRWEERARDDEAARAVLRAYLGLREILWEFGLRRGGAGAAGGRRRRPPRVQRVPVEE